MKRAWFMCLIGWSIAQPFNISTKNWKGMIISFMAVCGILVIPTIIDARDKNKGLQ
jgi:hypothetical protein